MSAANTRNVNAGVNMSRSAKKLPLPSRATKAVILARVSTEEQEKGYSIDAQLHRLQEYCERKELKPIESFTVVNPPPMASGNNSIRC